MATQINQSNLQNFFSKAKNSFYLFLLLTIFTSGLVPAVNLLHIFRPPFYKNAHLWKVRFCCSPKSIFSCGVQICQVY